MFSKTRYPGIYKRELAGGKVAYVAHWEPLFHGSLCTAPLPLVDGA
jgi:hypothetical protein